ncbi:MAG: archaeal proteasome endopeptidase complex subunit alpha [Candidatus Woesearchaeota archaeon]
MQPMNHQLMGYDRAITMFSPDGRLLQVEYAKKTVKQGSTALGIACQDGIVLMSDKRLINKLIIPHSVEKIFEIDQHIGATASGIISDARILIERSQVKAQQGRVSYDSPADIISIVKDLANLMQMTTQTGAYRPFGVSLIIGGVDQRGSSLYVVDPTGIFFQYRAVAIGEGDAEAETVLQEGWNETLSTQQGISLGLKALQSVLKENFDIHRVDCVVITDTYQRMSTQDLQQHQ